ncbi:MAG TPA: two-component regulator propeller domain-containing protein [Pyrinomonadaceae bacterium]
MRTPRAILSLLFLSLALVPARAEQLPVRTYTTADGLARDHVLRIVQDSRGFIWFCTIEGLSRFDGYGFTNYGTARGLPNRIVSDLVETRGGTYFVATDSGFALFDPDALTRRDAEGRPALGRLFTVIPFPEGSRAKEAYIAYEDAEGQVWCGTDHGLFRLAGGPGAWRLEPVWFLPGDAETDSDLVVRMVGDTRGTLWVMTPAGVVRRDASGRVTLFTKHDGLSVNATRAVVIDVRGHLWVGTANGLCEFESAPAEGPLKLLRVYSKEDGLPGVNVTSLTLTDEGELWVGLHGGLARFAPREGGGPRFVAYTPAEGLNDPIVVALHVDDAGNLWAGSESGGAMKIARSGILSYGPADGLKHPRIGAFIRDDADRFFVMSGAEGAVVFSRPAGRGLEETSIPLPPGVNMPWGWYQLTVKDREGDWWVPASAGVRRYDSGFRLKRIHEGVEGPCPDYVFRAFEDSRGDLWFGSLGHRDCVLSRWERATGRFVRYSPADGMTVTAPTAFAEDGAGNLWIGLYNGGIVRRRDGRFEHFTKADGGPDAFVRGLFLDRQQRLWVGTSGDGVARIDDPTAERPRFKFYTTREGLASDQVTCVTEDPSGLIYLGTGRGLDRLDVETGRVRHYTAADGLASNFVNVCATDGEGSVWVGTLRGLSRLTSPPARPRRAPPVLVTSLRVGGEPFPVSEIGTREVSGLTLEAGRNQLQVDFVGLDYGAGHVLRYQYKLEGADADWSAPTVQRSVNYANLAPGSYRFLVRALDADGAASPQPAAVSFRALPPFWRRWWFVLSAALVVCAIAFGVERMFASRRRERVRAEAALRRSKEERLAELERVRKRIATDLHDDIGSSLTQIAVLSEVARRGPGAGAEQLAQISAVSNELVESMSDIVWAINPKKDRLSDLTQRMRRFASDVFTARGVAIRFEGPAASDAEGDVRLGADLRREVFLIFKESVNNAVKHSGATRAEVEFRLEGNELLLRVADDGRGFDASGAGRSGEYERTIGGAGGNGLYSLCKRARELGGEYEVRSAPGAGTTVSLRLPVGRPREGDGGSHYPNGR